MMLSSLQTTTLGTYLYLSKANLYYYIVCIPSTCPFIMLYSSWHSSRFPPCSSTGDKQDTLVFILPFSLTIYTCILHEECNMTLAHHMMTLIENITTAGQYSIYPWALLLRDECIKLCLLRVEGDSNQSTAFVCSSKKEAIKDYIYPIDPPTLYTMSEIQADHHPPSSTSFFYPLLKPMVLIM